MSAPLPTSKSVPASPPRATLKLAQASALTRLLLVIPVIAAIWVVLLLLVHA